MLAEYFKALSDLMAAESRMLATFYRHRGKLGENREAIIQRFLATYLPRRFGVGSGFALFGDEVSTQQDVVVYDALNNPILFPDSIAPLFPPSALAAVVEVKSTLTRDEIRDVVKKTQAVKQSLRAAFANHPEPPRSEALASSFAFGSRLSVAEILRTMKEAEDDLGVEMADRLDMVCLLGKGIILGGSLFYSTTNNGDPLLPATPRPRQQRLAVEAEQSLFIFYSRLLDYILGRRETRPQLMSYVPADLPLGTVVGIG
jgi:hypothetical protein